MAIKRMHITDVIQKPKLTEKSYAKISEGKYTFIVNKKSNKTQVKKAFESIFEVKVEKVNIINTKSKHKRVGRYEGMTKALKKAIITLKPGEQLNLFNEQESD